MKEINRRDFLKITAVGEEWYLRPVRCRASAISQGFFLGKIVDKSNI